MSDPRVAPPVTGQNAPVALQGVTGVSANPPARSALPLASSAHDGYVRDSPSGHLVAVGGGGTGGYTTIQVNGTPLSQEDTLNLVGTDLNGSDVGGVTTVDFDPAPPENVTLSHTPNLLQAGASVVNPAFTATYTITPTTAILTDTEAHTDDVTSTPTSFVSPHTFTKSVYGQSVTFTLSATSPDADGSANTGITWVQKVWWGAVVDPGSGYNSAFINALSNSNLQAGPNGSFAVNATGGKSTFFATRTAFGLTTANFFVGAFPFAVSKVAAAVAYTNSNGVVENYDVWRSDNVDLGAFSFTVS